METAENDLVLLALLVSIAVLLVAASFIRVPYPILLVLGGLALGFVPGLPEFELPPELVLVAFLPPLLYSAAFFTPLRELRANVGPISVLATGVVLATTVGVAVVAHDVADLPWAAAFALGAIVAPTDPLAATTIARRFGVSRRVVGIVEGESLINDGTALVLYRFAVAAVVTGAFSIWKAGLVFVLSVVGGVAIGLGVGFVVRMVRRRLDHSPTEIALALMTGYLAYLPAEALEVSGVLAAVTVGVYMGWYTPELTTAQTRLQGQAVWEIVTFVLNSILFALIGFQLPTILDDLDDYTTAQLVGYGALIAAAVVVIRFACVFAAATGARLFPGMQVTDLSRIWKPVTLVGWMGMRGAVSLAAALALPLETDAGDPFPGRSLIIFLAFCVILVTLVLQGLSLPALIRKLGAEVGDEDAYEESKARLLAAEAAIARIEELVGEDWVYDDSAERLRGLYEFRRRRFGSRFDEEDDSGIEARSVAYQRLRRELLAAERQALVQLQREGRISGEAARRVLRDLDLEDTRLEI